MPVFILKRKRAKKRRGGRRLSAEVQTESFLLFAGAVIEIQNKNQFCDYAAIFQTERGQRKYHPVSPEIYKKLVDSLFPPQLLAVAVSDVIPLNYITRGGRHTSSLVDLQWKPLKMTSEQIAENENDHLMGKQNQNVIPLTDDIQDSEGYETDIYSEIDSRNNLIEPGEPQDGDRQLDQGSLRKIKPVKGTPVQHINFIGGVKITRRMACYWRNDCHLEYNRCKKFIESLIIEPTPYRPHYESPATTNASLISMRFNDRLKKSRK
jgi:hypothetical protein